MEEAATKTVAVLEYDVPPEIGNGVTTIGLRELTAQDELMSSRRAAGDSFQLAYELAKSSLAEVNEKKVSLADGSTDKAWDTFNSQLRQLVLTAYAEIHNVDEKKTKDFLKSKRVKVR